MRIHIRLTANKSPVPFTYQEQITGTLHKWLKNTDIHSGISLYSFSQLKDGKMKNNALEFGSGSYFFISCWKTDMIKLLIKSIRKDPEVAFGMQVKELIIQENPDFTNMEYFRVASPIVIHRVRENKHQYYYYDDNEADKFLIETIRTKMESANLDLDKSLQIEFDNDYNNPQKKRINYKGISNPCSICPVIIKGDNLTKQFIWNVGLGNSTGIGFGSIY